MKTSSTICRVYIASLSDYSSGILHGEWMDFYTDIHEQVKAMLAKSTQEDAEEWAIHDHEGFPKGLVQEHSNLDELADWAEFIEETDDNDLIQAAMDCSDSHSLDDVKATMGNQIGSFDRGNLGAWAQEQCEACHDVPQFLACHIDWEGVGREMLHDYQYAEVGGTTYLFGN